MEPVTSEMLVFTPFYRCSLDLGKAEHLFWLHTLLEPQMNSGPCPFLR